LLFSGASFEALAYDWFMNVSQVISIRKFKLAPVLLSFVLACFAGLSAAQAQSLVTTKHDSSQPIEITADQLEVQQEKQLATFSGNVQAIQGDIRLRAASLQVRYRAQDGSADVEGAISRIIAKGQVFFSSPGQTARGDSGVYDVDKSLVTLEGKVVLTREDNVIKGNRLVLNLATGRSKVSGAPSGTGGRVRGLFVPNKKTAK
jgi:lipopolysaccharide export system protein LptA